MEVFLGFLTTIAFLNATEMLAAYEGGGSKSRPGMAASFGIVVWLLALAGGFWLLLAFIATCYSCYLWWDTRSGIKKRKNTKPPTVQQIKPEPYTPLQDTPEVAAVRKRSLEAMKRADDSRRRDMKSRCEQPAENIYTSRYLDEIGSYLADIEFDYRDAGGHDSHRHVGVEAVDDEYFEGHCYKAEATRTFVIGRVRGKVLDRDTGELLPPKKWADGVRDDPRNSGVVKSRGWKSPDDLEEEEREPPIEILFTGFAKDQRAELEEQAKMFGMVVRKNVTKGLKYICAGPNAGPAKLAQAADAGVQIINESEFVQLLIDL
jgi:hypothetical protein